MFGIAIELSGACPHCDSPVMVNALSEHIHCPRCLRDRSYGFAEWADLLESIHELRADTEPGTGGVTTLPGDDWRLLYARFDPYCYACKHDLDMDELMASEDAYACPSCGERWRHRAAPPQAREAMPWLRWLVAEDPEAPPAEEPRRWFLWVEGAREHREPIALEDVLDEIDPELDLTLEGDDDPGAFEPPLSAASAPVTPRATAPRPPSDTSFWLLMAGGAVVVVVAVVAWVLLLGM